jgi:hypothetical protein
MPLIGNYTGVTNADELVKDQLEKAKLDYFCFVMMSIDINEITKENLGDVWLRTNFVQNHYKGGWFTADGVSYDYTMKDIAKYVGYKTNCDNENTAWFLRTKGEFFAKEYQKQMLELLTEVRVENSRINRKKKTQVEA